MSTAVSQQIDNLRRELRSVSAHVEEVSRAVSRERASDDENQRLPFVMPLDVAVAAFGASYENPGWALFFDAIADQGHGPQATYSIAELALTSQRASVRTAAARALAAMGGRQALDILKIAINQEGNERAAKIMRGALEMAAS